MSREEVECKIYLQLCLDCFWYNTLLAMFTCILSSSADPEIVLFKESLEEIIFLIIYTFSEVDIPLTRSADRQFIN